MRITVCAANSMKSSCKFPVPQVIMWVMSFAIVLIFSKDEISAGLILYVPNVLETRELHKMGIMHPLYALSFYCCQIHYGRNSSLA